MSKETVWLLLSFAIMVVAVLATLYEKLERLEERLRRLEGRDGADDDGIPVAGWAGAGFTQAGRRRDHRA